MLILEVTNDQTKCPYEGTDSFTLALKIKIPTVITTVCELRLRYLLIQTT